MSGNSLAPNEKPASVGRSALGAKIFLCITAALLIGWLSWLSYTALTKSREPIVSRAQATATEVVIVGEVKAQGEVPAVVVNVKETLSADGLESGKPITVRNLPICTGYTEPGDYLLLLRKVGPEEYLVVGQQSSPGADLDGVGPPMIYKWGPDVRAQVLRMFPSKD